MQVPWIFFFRGRACFRWGEATVHHIEAETPEFPFSYIGFASDGWERHRILRIWSEAARISSANVRDNLLGTAGTSGAAKPSTQSASGGELGRSLRSAYFVFESQDNPSDEKNHAEIDRCPHHAERKTGKWCECSACVSGNGPQPFFHFRRHLISAEDSVSIRIELI